jgi:hypothetical protein
MHPHIVTIRILLIAGFLCVNQRVMAEDAPSAPGGEGGTASIQQSGQQAPVQPMPTPPSSIQVEPPSVTLPTPPLPPLPPPLQEATPEQQQQPAPQPTPPPRPEFNPPSAENLNLPSAQPAGNPQFAPSSVGMPVMKLNDANPGGPLADSGPGPGPGPLGSMFDWAKKLRFQAAVRGGYDNNVNSSHSNAIASTFGNLNGGVNYRFGTPRLNFNADLTGGLSWYPNEPGNQSVQGVVGLGLSVEYRYSPRLVLTFNTSSSYQQQPNASLIGTSQNQNGAYFFTANSLSGAYQWSDILTTVTRINFSGNYYLEQSLNNQQGFTQPGFGESFRWLVKPTTTAVLDYNTDNYGYVQAGNNSWGQSLAAGFDHIFNPKWFWNLRSGAEFRTYQNTYNSGTYIGPYVDHNLNWAYGQNSSVAWVAHLGTQPSGQQNVSYSPAFRTGLNCTQGITAKLNASAGFFYLIQYYNDAPYGAPTAQYPNGSLINYYQTNLQGNIAFNYALNRILQLSLGYQYLGSLCDKVPSQAYNRGISYLQLGGAF